MTLNNLTMDITQRINELTKERDDLQIVKDKAHDRIKEISRTIGKLQTVLKDAEEILGEKTSAEDLTEITENLK